MGGAEETEEQRRARKAAQKAKEKARLKKSAKVEEKRAVAKEAAPQGASGQFMLPIHIRYNKSGLGSRGHHDNHARLMGDFRYRTDLPEVPIGPRSISVPVDLHRYADCSAFPFESARPDPLVDQELGISLEPSNAATYRVPKGPRAAMDPADAALFGTSRAVNVRASGAAAAAAAAAGAVGGSRRRRQYGHVQINTGNWLMRTVYMADAHTIYQNADENYLIRRMRARAEGGGEAAYGDALEEAERMLQAQLALIDATFEAAQKPPVHATNPALRAVEVLPILPNFDRWVDEHVHIKFDHEPLSDVAWAAQGGPDARALAARAAFIKSFQVPTAGGGAPEKLAVYFAPAARAAAPLRAALAAEAAAGANGKGLLPGEVPYDWVREFAWGGFRSEPGDHPTVALLVGSGAATYVPVSQRADLSRRVVRKEAGRKAVERASSVTVRRRPRTEDEEEARERKIRKLERPDEMDEEERVLAEAEAAAAAGDEEAGGAAAESPARVGDDDEDEIFGRSDDEGAD